MCFFYKCLSCWRPVTNLITTTCSGVITMFCSMTSEWSYFYFYSDVIGFDCVTFEIIPLHKHLRNKWGKNFIIFKVTRKLKHIDVILMTKNLYKRKYFTFTETLPHKHGRNVVIKITWCIFLCCWGGWGM